MGKKTAKTIVGNVLRRQGLYVMFFGYVCGHRDADPAVTWSDTAKRFMDRYNLTEDDVEPESLIREAQKMTVDFLSHGI